LWGLISLSSSYFDPDNSLENEAKGLSRADPFRSLSPIEVERLRLVRGMEKGWDGGEAEPVEAEAIEAARDLLLSLKSQHPAAQDARVLPIADGRIQLEWHDVDRSLEFEFTHPGWIAVGLDRSNPSESAYYSAEMASLESHIVAAAYDWFIRRNSKIAPWPSP
jgi:hypothetical protein